MSPPAPARPACRSPPAWGLFLAVAGCFRDDPPSFDCGPFDQCPPATTGATTTAAGTTGVATASTTGSTGTPTTGAPADNGRYFRIEELRIIDPHLFYGMPCLDITGMVNASAIADKIAAGEFNLLLSFKEFDLNALEPSLSEAESCDLMANTCVPKMSLSLSVAAERIDVGECSTLDPAVLSAPDVAALNSPQPTCFRTLKAELALPINGVAVPLQLVNSQVVFNLDPLDDATEVTNGLLYGFFTRESAEATTLTLLMLQFSVWDLVTGQPDPAGCAAANPNYLPSDDLLEGQQGVWMAVNFKASRVDVVSP